jgi:outer membrane protein assembly factor BamB
LRKQPSSAGALARVAVLAGVVIALVASVPPAPSAAGPQLTPAAALKRPRPTPTPTPTPTPVPTPTPTPPPPPPTDSAVAFQVGAEHAGSQPGDALTPGLARRWEVDLGGTVSYPLIADGNVYVTVSGFDARGDVGLYALDQRSGRSVWGPVVLSTSSAFAAYDGGKVFVQQSDAVLRAFDSRTGALAWTATLPGQPFSNVAPVARNGTVYTVGTGSGGNAVALSETTGGILWSASVVIGGQGSPAVTGTDLYLADDCNVYDLDPAAGAQVWRDSRGCTTGSGVTPVSYGGRLYARNASGQPSQTLDGRTGAQVGTFSAGPPPAFDGSQGFFLNGRTLEARDLGTGAVTWTFTAPPAFTDPVSGVGALVSAPTVANGYVYVASSSGSLYALAEGTGQVAWSDRVGVGFQSPERAALAIGQGGLAAPFGSTLVFYTSAVATTPSPQPPPSGGQDQSRSYQLNAQHTGGQDADPLRFPFAKLWSATTSGPPTYPLIAGGHLYFADGGTLFARNTSDGGTIWGPITLSQSPVRPVYDNGDIFALGADGSLWALDATTGTQLWRTQLPGSGFQSYPTAVGGTVYVAGGGSLFAVGESTGAVLWSQSVLGAGDSSPVVTATGVYLAYTCPEVYDFDPGTGALIWHVGPSSCSSQGGGPRSAVLYQGRLYVRDTSTDLVLDAGTGAQLGVFRSVLPPAFSGSMAFYTNASSVEGWDLTTGSMVWRWDTDSIQIPGGGQSFVTPDSPPIVVNGYVLLALGPNVYALDGRTGRQVWMGATGSSAGSTMAFGVSAGEGFAAVAVGGAVEVFSTGGAVNPPAPTAADESVTHQVGVAHIGAQAGDALAPPLSQRWAKDLGGPVTYALIVGGRAYFAVQVTGGAQLNAVDLATGAPIWGPVGLQGSGQTTLAADGGRVFVQQSGALHAFDAQSGTELWSRFSGSNPVAAGGRLYAGPMRLDEETGALIWRTSEQDSRFDTVTDADVYVDVGGETVADLDASSGLERWRRSSASSVPFLEPALYGGRLYLHDAPPSALEHHAILDSTTGAQVGTYTSDAAAAFAGNLAYFVNGGALEAHNLPDLGLAWTFAGDGKLATSPVVANGVVYVGSTNGNLYGLDAVSGTLLWTTAIGSAMSMPDPWFAPELTDLAVGEGWLLVPAGTRLVAYSIAGPVASRLQVSP